MLKVSRLATLALNEARHTAAHVRLSQQAVEGFVSHAQRTGEILSRIKYRLGADHFRTWIATQPELSDALADAYVRFSEYPPTGETIGTMLRAMAGEHARR